MGSFVSVAGSLVGSLVGAPVGAFGGSLVGWLVGAFVEGGGSTVGAAVSPSLVTIASAKTPRTSSNPRPNNLRRSN